MLTLSRQSPWPVLKHISWSVLPLVAGLFVMVEALVKLGTIGELSAFLHEMVAQSPRAAAWGAGLVIAIANNIANNLPVGLVAPLRADVALWVLLGRQCVGVMHQIDFHGCLRDAMSINSSDPSIYTERGPRLTRRARKT